MRDRGVGCKLVRVVILPVEDLEFSNRVVFGHGGRHAGVVGVGASCATRLRFFDIG